MNALLADYARNRSVETEAIITQTLFPAVVEYIARYGKARGMHRHTIEDITSHALVMIPDVIRSYDSGRGMFLPYALEKTKLDAIHRLRVETDARRLRDGIRFSELEDSNGEMKICFRTRYDHALEAERLDSLYWYLSKLPMREMRAVCSVYLHGKTRREVSKEMCVDPSYVTLLIQKGFKRIREWEVEDGQV